VKRILMAHRVRGLSLVELLVALVIGLVLMLGLVQVFAASRAAYQLSEGISRAQENGRFAMDFLQRDIRMAGHFGCTNDQARRQASEDFHSHFTAGGVLDFGFSIRGYENAAPTGITLNPARINGTDSIVLRFLTGNGVPVLNVDSSNPGAPFIDVAAARWSTLQEGGVSNPRLFGISDCRRVDVFAAANVNPGSGRVTAPAGVDLLYGTSPEGGPAMLYRAEAVVYYIGNGTGGQPSLWRARINHDGSLTSEELVEGIENLQFRYGIDRNPATDPTGFMATQGAATDVGSSDLEWRRVGQVQVALLASSPRPAGSAQATSQPTLLGTAVSAADDGRYRAVYETTIALRNRLYGN